MPITSSAKKALRVSKKKKIFNARKENKIDSMTKKFRKLVTENKPKDAEKMLPELYQAIDKAVKIKFYKKNTAARMKSRLTLSLNKSKKTK